jgi:hypothetical protein
MPVVAVANLLRPSDQERTAVAELCSVSVRAADFSGYLDVLRDPANSPLTRMQIERQQRSDCQGNATANGEECRSWYCSGRQTMPVLSEIYAYNASEYAMQPSNVGGDRGTSIHSGVRVLVDGLPKIGVAGGLPEESDWPYSQYCRRASEFEKLAKAVNIVSPHVTEVGDMPDWDDMLAALAAGATGHIGTFWGVDWKQVAGAPRRVMDSAPRSGGGHATEILWAVEVKSVWYLAVWNSHGDGYYLMSRKAYDQLQKNKWEPFGAYLLTPDRMVERYDRITQGGGYFA